MCYQCLNNIRGEISPEFMQIIHPYLRAQEQYFINGNKSIEGTWIGEEKPSGLQPGQGVTVVDKNDPNKNHKRDGFVRDSKNGPFHPTLDTNEYNVWFEPGEPDCKYKGTQIEPNGQQIDPGKMPPKV